MFEIKLIFYIIKFKILKMNLKLKIFNKKIKLNIKMIINVIYIWLWFKKECKEKYIENNIDIFYEKNNLLQKINK